ncbi:hypothetical protein TSOC_006531 [Tetrabaena socialis]|uniref:Endoplasmic reticulum membrane protein C16E8.02 n=1 Tax=Tetrabaena socialis TaxID=47790 RepID=A0A2J8A3C4_9CHLO|nr:hypothetical protein TSOC_006531 [Tetrabaena socialis]|eukprot:PNH07027.1 hypothetical protein TSOC_006531 [Tetrabaena socialis]
MGDRLAALQPTNPAFLLAALYGTFYLALDFFAGATWALGVGLPLAWSATAFAGSGLARPWAWALGLQVLAWYLQLHPGHGLLERRKPALMDSLVQAFALAPFFVWFELLFLLGYRPALRQQLKQRVDELIAKMDAERQPLVAKHEGGSGGGGDAK